MSEDLDLQLWKRRRILEMQKQASFRKQTEQPYARKKVEENPETILSRAFTGRAKEVLQAAKNQYPRQTAQLTGELARLISEGKLTSPISGENLFWLFRRLGLPIRLETNIRIVESGKLKSIADKLKGT